MFKNRQQLVIASLIGVLICLTGLALAAKKDRVVLSPPCTFCECCPDARRAAWPFPRRRFPVRSSSQSDGPLDPPTTRAQIDTANRTITDLGHKQSAISFAAIPDVAI